MIHLFKKVYLTTDRHINTVYDRVVISATYGHPMASDVASLGRVLLSSLSLADAFGADKKYTSFGDLLNTIDANADLSKKCIIYADDISLSTLLHAWYRRILPRASDKTIDGVINSCIFKLNTFQLRSINIPLSTERFAPVEKLAPGAGFIVGAPLSESVMAGIGVEFLLATYLATGAKKTELKRSLAVLIGKELEQYLYEFKEILLVHLLTSRLTKRLQLPVTPSLNNIHEMLTWQSPYVDVLTSPRLWKCPYMAAPSASNPNVNLSALTPTDVETIKRFAVLLGEAWSDALVLNDVKPGVNKLDFLPTQHPETFTDELLNEIIKVESTFIHSAGSFFTIDLTSVNYYLVTAILEANTVGDTTFVQELSL